MMLANFERLPAEVKGQLGDSLLPNIVRGKARSQELWALGRLGARIPFHGPLDQVLPAGRAAEWLDQLLAGRLPASEALARTLIQLARLTGDRERDVPAEKRDYVAGWLQQLPQGERLAEPLMHPETALRSQEQDWVFGESLPTGLVLQG
jgi:hypothetical protein